MFVSVAVFFSSARCLCVVPFKSLLLLSVVENYRKHSHSYTATENTLGSQTAKKGRGVTAQECMGKRGGTSGLQGIGTIHCKLNGAVICGSSSPRKRPLGSRIWPQC